MGDLADVVSVRRSKRVRTRHLVEQNIELLVMGNTIAKARVEQQARELDAIQDARPKKPPPLPAQRAATRSAGAVVFATERRNGQHDERLGVACMINVAKFCGMQRCSIEEEFDDA